jgi:hypothetical protein
MKHAHVSIQTPTRDLSSTRPMMVPSSSNVEPRTCPAPAYLGSDMGRKDVKGNQETNRILENADDVLCRLMCMIDRFGDEPEGVGGC